MKRGLFITFEGGEGSGKTTQISLLKSALESHHIPYITTREPGGDISAERIRELLVCGAQESWDPLAETLLFYAARVQHVNRTILPALENDKIVICDRFADSTRVYQGIGKGISTEYINSLHHLTLGNIEPDLTFILDIDPVIGLTRAKSRKDHETRFEDMKFEFHQQVRLGFLAIAANAPQRCQVIDATQPKEIIHQSILTRVIENIS